MSEERDFGLGIGYRGIRFHHYNYYEPGFQPEGIRRRIRQGVGGPDYLEEGAEVSGHLHVPWVNNPQIGHMFSMNFRGDSWLVQVTDLKDGTSMDRNAKNMIVQDDPHVTGYEIQGVCVRRMGTENPQGR